jgi:hypothetical protein
MSPVLPTDRSTARFSLVLPTTWRMIDMDPATRDRSVERMVRTAVGRADRLATMRRWAVRAYREVLAGAADAGAFFAATYGEEIGGRPLSASLLAFLVQCPLGADANPIGVAEMAGELAAGANDERLAEAPRLVDLPVGTAVRTRARVGAGFTGSDGREPDVDVVRFFVPVTEWATMLVIAFSTPVLPAADAFAELFDQLATTARWRQ